MPGTQQVDHCWPFVPPLTNFSLFSKVQRTIPSGWPVSPKASPATPHVLSFPPHIRPHQITCCPPDPLLLPKCAFLKSSFPLLGRPFLSLSFLICKHQASDTSPGVLFLLPEQRMHGCPFRQHRLWFMAIWTPVILECSSSGLVPSHLCILSAWHGAWDTVGTQKKCVEFHSIPHPSYDECLISSLLQRLECLLRIVCITSAL